MKRKLLILMTSVMCVGALSVKACAYNTLKPCGTTVTLHYDWEPGSTMCTYYCDAPPGQVIQVAGGASSGTCCGTPTTLNCTQSCTVTSECTDFYGQHHTCTQTTQVDASYASGAPCSQG
jgi:hypothetical protein